MAPVAPFLSADLVAAGERWLAEIGSAVDAADPEARVAPRSRLLCAGLGSLAQATYHALGGRRHADAVGRAAALLSLVTKIDDQVIDDPRFHHRHGRARAGEDRSDLRARTRSFLAPTLSSIRSARPETGEPRCALAAELGASLRRLGAGASGGPRLEHLLDTIAGGWEVQVEAVAVLTAHPASVTRAEVAAVTRAISGAWLLMIAMVGTLPDDAGRALSPEEEAEFFAWGWAIQRADALADLAKDLADGHLSSWPGLLLWERAGDVYLDAARRGDDRVYPLLRAHGVDCDCLPDEAEAAALRTSLAGLGEVPALLAWIHAYLAQRYQAHPLAAGAAVTAALGSAIGAGRFFPQDPWDGRGACSAP